jgi:hypothetical protein
MITRPTCEEIYQEDLGDAVLREADDSWRHGSYVTEVYHRATDNTYWQVSYDLSTDRETNGLRDGSASVVQVEQYEKTVKAYRIIQ